jgi:diguanylate cyclase
VDAPDAGSVSPNSFLPIADESELIAQIGARAREESLRRLTGWWTEGTVTDDFHLSVNVSSCELNDPDLPCTIAGELARLDMPAAAGTLELNESITLDGPRVRGRALSELRAMGRRPAHQQTLAAGTARWPICVPRRSSA